VKNENINFYFSFDKINKIIFIQIISHQTMGSGNSKTESLHYDVKDWDEVERSTLYEVMRSKRGE